MDSALATDTISFDTLNAIMEGLARTGEGGVMLPGMATKWEVNGPNYTFTLRKGAVWSDGKPVTSKDFKYAWLRALDPQTASDYSFILYFIKGAEAFNSLDLKDPAFATKYADLKSKVAIETPDDSTLKVTLNGTYGFWLGLMSFPTYLPQREDIVTKFGDKYAAESANMVFNGPFVMEKWVHEDSIVLAKNVNYWDAAAVKLEKVNWKMIKDSNTAIQLYETGELDSVGIPGDFIAQYKDKGLQTMADTTSWWLTFNHNKPHFKNAKMRKAFDLALDRKGFVDNVLKNGSVVASGVVPPSMPSHESRTFRALSGNFVNASVNAAEAKKLWEEAKAELKISSLTITLLAGDSSTAKRYNAAVKEMLEAALPGLTVEISAVAFAVRLAKTNARDYDIVYQGWGADYNDPMTFMDLWLTKGPHNDGDYSSAAYDALIKKAQESSDNKVRMESMAAAEKILLTDLPILPLYHPARNFVQRPYLKGVLRFPLGAGTELKWAFVEGKAK